MRVFEQFSAVWVAAHLPLQLIPIFSSFDALGRELERNTGRLDVNRVNNFLQ